MNATESVSQGTEHSEEGTYEKESWRYDGGQGMERLAVTSAQ